MVSVDPQQGASVLGLRCPLPCPATWKAVGEGLAPALWAEADASRSGAPASCLVGFQGFQDRVPSASGTAAGPLTCEWGRGGKVRWGHVPTGFLWAPLGTPSSQLSACSPVQHSH